MHHEKIPRGKDDRLSYSGLYRGHLRQGWPSECHERRLGGHLLFFSRPVVTVSLRKATYTYGNIMEQKAYTVSIPSQDFIREADYFGIASGRDEDKFFASGLTPVKSDLVNAPYIKEFPLSLECRLLHTLEVGLHTLFIGEILDVKAEESILGDDGKTRYRKDKTPDIFTGEAHPITA